MKKPTQILMLAATWAAVTTAQAQLQVVAPVGVTLEDARPDGGSPGPWLNYPGNDTPASGSNWFNDSGLEFPLATGDLVPDPWPTHEAFTGGGSAVASRVRDTGETTPQGEATLVFDLGGSFTLEGIAFWNGNEGGNTLRGVETMALSYSSDGVNFTPGETLTWTEGVSGSPIPAEIQTLTASVPGVTHVKMVVNTFTPPQGILNFGEIRMIAVPPPSLSWASGSANWTGTDVWVDEFANPASFAGTDIVFFEDTLSGASPITVTLNDTVTPESITFANSAKDFTISGSGTISGATGLSKSGTGMLTLATANDYSGGTSLSGGQLNIGNASALGTGTFTIAGGTIDNSSGSSLAIANNNPMEWNGNFAFAGTNDLDLGIGTVTLGATRTVDVQASNLTVGGEISGTAGLTKSGIGTLTLTGIGTYTGNTTVADGVLEVNSGDAIPDAGSLTIGSTGVVELTQDETVRSLFFDDLPQSPGTYSSSASATATDFKSDRLTGDAVLTVAQADVLFWDTSAAEGFQKASGDWSTTAPNWSPEGTALSGWGQGATANFGGDNTPATITLTEDLGANDLIFLNSGYTLVGDGTPRMLTLGGEEGGAGLPPRAINLAEGSTTTLGSDVTISADATINIGLDEGQTSGTLDILTGAVVQVTGGETGGIGEIRIIGIDTQVNLAGSLLATGNTGISNGTGRINIGGQTASGTDATLTIQDGGELLIQTPANPSSSNSSANLIQLGFASNNPPDPSAVRGTIIVEDGGRVQVGSNGERQIRVGQWGTGIVEIQPGGLVQAGNLILGNGGPAVGTLNLNGGILETGQVFVNKADSEANFDGGTIVVTGETGGTIIRNGAGTALIRDGGLTIDTNGLDTTADEDLLFAGDGGLTKTGSGTLVLTGSNDYDGATTIDAGTLLINGNNSVAFGDVLVNNDATLGGEGSVGGDVTVAAAASLAPGASAGTLFLDGALDISAMTAGPGTLDFELDSIAGTNDLIDLLADLTIGDDTFGVSDLSITNLGGLEVGTYTLLISAGDIIGTLDDTDLNGPIASGFNGMLQINGSDIELVVTAGTASPYDTWAAGFPFEPGDDTTATGDPDGDGANNFTEFAFNGDPTDSGDNGQIGFLIQDASAPAGDEFTLIVAVRDGASFTSSGTTPSVVQTASADGVTYTIEGSLDLVTIPGSDVAFASGPSDTAPAAAALPDLTGTDWEYQTFKLVDSEGLTAPKGFMRAAAAETP